MSSSTCLLLFTASLLLPLPLHAQFDQQDSHSTASLRGIDTAGPQVAWASGSAGTILHTDDAGQHWQACMTPSGGQIRTILVAVGGTYDKPQDGSPSAALPGWNAIALPYIVASKGRIARIRPDALKP